MSLEGSIRKAVVESINDSDLIDEDPVARPRGGPRLPPEKRKRHPVTVAFTDEEYQKLLEASEKAVTKVQTWIRRAVASTLLTRKDDLGLTEREREVVTLVAEGHCNRVIGKKLDISPHTVKFHIANLMRKLNVDNRAGIAAVAVRLGLA